MYMLLDVYGWIFLTSAFSQRQALFLSLSASVTDLAKALTPSIREFKSPEANHRSLSISAIPWEITSAASLRIQEVLQQAL